MKLMNKIQSGSLSIYKLCWKTAAHKNRVTIAAGRIRTCAHRTNLFSTQTPLGHNNYSLLLTNVGERLRVSVTSRTLRYNYNVRCSCQIPSGPSPTRRVGYSWKLHFWRQKSQVCTTWFVRYSIDGAGGEIWKRNQETAG